MTSTTLNSEAESQQRPRMALLRAIRSAVRPDEKTTISEWAAKHRILPPDVPEAGKWRNLRTPYLIDIQNTMSPGTDWVEGWVKKGHQLGGSAAGENFIGHAICQAAGSLLLVFPTIEDAKQWEMTRFAEMRSSTPELRRRIRPPNVRGADNTKLRKKFSGGVMRLVGSNRVGALKSSTIRYIKFEEPDEYVADLGDQGDPITLAKKRSTNFGRRARIYGDGTPTIEGASAIDRHFKRGDQRRWHLCCPDCKHAQPLEWKQVKWRDDDPASAAYACISCGALNPEHVWKSSNYDPRSEEMTEEQCAAASLAHWRATAIGMPGVASWHLPSLVAPIGWRPWHSLVSEWLAAQGDESLLKTFRQTVEGEPYADTVRSTVGAAQLQQRAEPYDLMTCPHAGLLCTAGVDTQDNRLAIVIRAWGRGEESWGVWHSEIYGHPSSPETWAKLSELLMAPIQHASGQIMHVDAAAIDAGGHHGEDVYAFCRHAQLRGRHWFAIRGAKSYDAPKLGKPKKIEFTWRGQPVPGGAELRFIGTQALKNLIDGRLRLAQAGGGTYHFPMAFEADYYTQLRSERREWRRDQQGNKALWWIKGNERNEAWDCEVYALAAYLYAMAGQHAETIFRNREKLFGRVRQLALLDDGAQAVQAPAPPPSDEDNPDEAHDPARHTLPAPVPPAPALMATQRQRRGRFLNRWA